MSGKKSVSPAPSAVQKQIPLSEATEEDVLNRISEAAQRLDQSTEGLATCGSLKSIGILLRILIRHWWTKEEEKRQRAIDAIERCGALYRVHYQIYADEYHSIFGPWGVPPRPQVYKSTENVFESLDSTSETFMDSSESEEQW